MSKDKVSLKPSLRALKTTLIKLKLMGKNIYDEEEEKTRLRKTSSNKSCTFSCAQPKTCSFRVTPSGREEDVCKSFNSLYIVSSDLKPSTRPSLCFASPEEEHEDANGVSKRTGVIICDENDMIFDAAETSSSYKNYFKWKENMFLDEEESLSLDMELTTSKSSNYSSDFSSEASSSTKFPAGVVRGLSSERFFFSPGRSNSILVEEKCLQTGSNDVTKRPFPQVDNISLETERNLRWGIDTVTEEEGDCEESLDIMVPDIFLRDSVAMTTYSTNPYLDFKSSMEEMVSAHNLRDWSCLQELLCCYLTLNEKKTHKYIAGAFADLLMNLIACKSSSHSLLDYGLSSTD